MTAALLLAGGVVAASAQPAPSDHTPSSDPTEAASEAAAQGYALRLRDAEARLRAAHERMAAGGAESAQPPGTSPAPQELLDAAQAAQEIIRHAPPGVAGLKAYKTADRRFQEAFERLRQGRIPRAAEADSAREMLQALAALREVAGTPAAPPATGAPGGTPREPAAQGGGRA